jgi:hypothetical protein
VIHPYIYDCEKSIEVWKSSLSYLERVGQVEQIEELGWAYQELGNSIPQTVESLWSGHFFPFTESWEELQVSLNLCLFGFYKQSMVSLRCALELGLLSVYWNINDDGHLVVQDWLRSKENTPPLAEIWQRLSTHIGVRQFQSVYDLKSQLLKLNYLHNYVHTKGFKYSNRFGLLKGNSQSFESVAIDTWLASFREVVAILITLHIVKYPLAAIKYDYYSKFGLDEPWIGLVDPTFVERFEKVVGPEVWTHLEALAASDDSVKKILDWLDGLPDLTEGDYEVQREDWDKLMISNQGLDSWLKNWMTLYGEDAEKIKTRPNVAKLIAWAQENGYDKLHPPN